MGLLSKYSGKTILITGATGFVGKVLLQKILYSLSSVEKIYVFIRSKQGMNLEERFINQIVNSPCFNRLRTLHKTKFDDFIHSKIQIIKGDLLQPQLGLSQQVQQEIIQKCNVIINCAASIDFNARLDQSIESNIQGPIKMLNLAKQIKNLDIFTHISTAYANSDMRGLIKEEIYDKDKDPQDQLTYLRSLTISQLVENTKTIVGKFPNTYTYTKNLCQRLIKKRRVDIPICIIRPSIINTSYIQPVPGWIDNIAAAAALYMMVGLGIVHQVRGDEKKLVDTVPVDYVVSTIIVATAYSMRNPKLSIYHSAITDRNPFVMGKIKDLVVKYWNQNVVKNKFQKASLCYSQNQWKIRLSKMKRIPVQIYCRLSPLLGNQHKKNANKIQKTIAIGQKVASIFQYFLRNEWIFQCKNFYQLWNYLDASDRKQFLIDVTQIDFVKYIQLNNYGIQYYVLKENAEIPINNLNMLTFHQQKSYFSDIKWIWNNELPQNYQQNTNKIKSKLFLSKQIHRIIKSQILKRQQISINKGQTVIHQVNIQVEDIIDSILGNTKISTIKTMTWTLHKIFKKIYERININTKMLQEIRQIEKNSEVPIIIVPSRRSHFDFLIVSYIFFAYKLRLPLLIHDEGIVKSSILNYFAKKYGSHYFNKDKYQKSILYKTVFDEYIQLLLKEGNTVQFFIESANSNCGRILNPQWQILNIALESLITNKIPQVCIVPITINYQKIFEDDKFPNQIFGKKKQESLIQVAKKMNSNFGRVYVEICKPIMGRQLIECTQNRQFTSHDENQKQQMKSIIFKEVISRMVGGVVIVSTAIVSSVLLMYKKGINKDLLVKLVTQIISFIVKKGYRVGGVNQNSPAIAITNSLEFLGNLINHNKNIYSLLVGKDKSPQKLLMLGHYRNTLIHVFLPEVFVSCVLSAFGDSINSQDINLSKIHEKTKLLILLLNQQYYLKYSLDSFSDFMQLIKQMRENDILQVIQDKIAICKSGVRMVPFYSSLIRYQIQSYWSSLVYIITIARNHPKHQISLLDHFYDTVQWFTKTLYNENVIQEFEACSKSLIINAFEKFQKQKLIRISAGGKKKKAYIEILASFQQLQALQSNIKFFLQNSILSSPIQFAKSSMKQSAKL